MSIGGGARDGPFAVVLGIAQDGGVPQAGTGAHPGWTDPVHRRHAACLGLVDPAGPSRWLVDATPDLREQLHALDEIAPVEVQPVDARSSSSAEPGAGRPHRNGGLAGILLTHAHVGHYTGLWHLGREAMATRALPVHAMPRMAAFLESNVPWATLVEEGHIDLRPLRGAVPLTLGPFEVTPLLVPHRGPHSETVAFRVRGPHRSLLYVPDIDDWAAWDAAGTRIERLLETVDVAYLDGTFFDDAELPDRDRREIAHPTIVATMARVGVHPEKERRKMRFIHLNHTNPALWEGTEARGRIARAGYAVAAEREVTPL